MAPMDENESGLQWNVQYLSEQFWHRLLREIVAIDGRRAPTPPPPPAAPVPTPPPPPQLRENLPQLPHWLRQQQLSDAVHRMLRMPAVLVVPGMNGTQQVFGSRTISSSSSIRFYPSLVTTHPAFRINIRQNHFVGAELQQHEAQRKTLKQRKQQVPKLTRWGFDAARFSHEHIEEEWEFELRQLSLLNTEMLTPEQLAEQYGAGLGLAAQGMNVLRVDVQVEAMQQPTRLLGQSLAAQFSPGSLEATISGLMPIVRQFTLFVDAGPLSSRADGKGPRNSAVIRDWLSICLPARHCSLALTARDDWHLARQPEYADKKFEYFIGNHRMDLKVPEHLVFTNHDQEEKFRPVYVVDQGLSPRTHFATGESYQEAFMQALFYDRMEERRQQEIVYNMDMEYPATFTRIEDARYVVDVRILSPRLVSGQAVPIPTGGTQALIYVPRLMETSGLPNKRDKFEAKVLTVTKEGFDISLSVKMSDYLQEIEHVMDTDTHMINILWSSVDETTRRRINAVDAVGRLLTPSASGITQDVASRPRAPFHIKRIISGATTPVYSTPFLHEWVQAVYDASHWNVIQQLLARLNTRQREAVDAILDGVYSNVLLLEGFPGTGKTSTCAIAIAILMLLGKKVVIVAQPNKAVDALFEGLIKVLLSMPELHHLLERIVRFKNEHDEDLLAAHLASRQVDLSGQFSTANYWMSHRVDKWIKDHPDDVDKQEYEQHVKTRELHTKAKSNRTDAEVKASARLQILEDSLVVACTSYVCFAKLDRTIFKTKVVFLDEASMSIEPDALMSTIQFIPLLELVVFTGDNRQLGPVVPSHTSERNPLGCLLSVSPLQRLADGWPELKHVELNVNYRGHPSTFAMANHLFYDDAMVPGGDMQRWDTPLARAVDGVLNKSGLASTFRARSSALRPDNRQFFLNQPGDCTIEPNGTSFFNKNGITAVLQLVIVLLAAGVDPGDIGIICMYGADRRALVRQLKRNNLPPIDTEDVDDASSRPSLQASTVDAFQGQEKKIMIVHFVAAHDFQSDQFGSDPFRFVKQARRLNVATTRAKEYQFLVGNMDKWSAWKHGLVSKRPEKARHMLELMEWVLGHGQVMDWAKANPELFKSYPPLQWSGPE